MLKGAAALAALLFAGGYVAGAFGPQPYSRKVGRPPAEVAAGLESLDITAQPGAPGTDPARSGGIAPLFRLEKANGRLTWYVMSGDKVATAMTATLTPVDQGRATLVKASVERGDAPDDFVSPAFRSEGLTLGLFAMALEGELNDLVAPPRADPATCARMLDRFTEANLSNGSLQEPEDLRGAISGTAKTVMRLHAMEAELRRAGCPTDGKDGEFRSVSSQMTGG